MAKKSVPPLNNIVYYPVGTRVLYNGEPGVVDSLVIKPRIEYEVGYNILLDSQISEKEPEIRDNSSYDELVLEKTEKKSTDGEYVAPLEKVED